MPAPAGAPCLIGRAGSHHSQGASVLDVVYIAATIVLFALVALIGKGVEKL
ncbi:hypothetical protein ACFXQA_04460 [Microbacterium sp. P07]|uniref:hypothetical protein n=1 Tax=Microbacterium sp. P07 TaxID=3366952 RepID=UPI0037471C9B